MNFGDFEITFREILVSIAITLILVGLGFLICGNIKNAINENNEKYFKALKIHNNEEMFEYAIKTNTRYTFVEGKVHAIEGVKIEDLDGTYFKIRKVKEVYTKHTRKVAHTRTVGNKTETYYTIEEYWTWDYNGEENFHTDRFNFLGVDFQYGTINFHNESHIDTKSDGYYIRYQYYVIPFEFEGTLFTYIENNTINQNSFSVNNTIDNIIKSKENETDGWSIAFWILWIIFIGVIDFIYVYLDNHYLED